MASHVVVIGANARKLTVKTTPSKHLSDVLLEACSKFGLDPDQHGLKYYHFPLARWLSDSNRYTDTTTNPSTSPALSAYQASMPAQSST